MADFRLSLFLMIWAVLRIKGLDLGRLHLSLNFLNVFLLVVSYEL